MARTIADLDASDEIREPDVTEALALRPAITAAAAGALSACAACVDALGADRALGGRIEILRRERQYIREVLELPDEDLSRRSAGRCLAPGGREYAAVTRAAARHGRAAAGQHGDLPSRCPPIRRRCPRTPARPRAFLAGAHRALVRAGRRTEAASLAADRRDRGRAVGRRRTALEIARRLGRGLSVAGRHRRQRHGAGRRCGGARGALEAGVATVAVLAGSADVAYPRSERRLYARGAGRRGGALRDAAGIAGFAWNVPGAQPDHRGAGHAHDRRRGRRALGVAHHGGHGDGPRPRGGRRCRGRPLDWRAAGTNELLREGCALVRDARSTCSIGSRGRDASMHRSPASGRRSAPGLAGRLHEVRAGRDTVEELGWQRPQAAGGAAALMDLRAGGHAARASAWRIVAVRAWPPQDPRRMPTRRSPSA